jgi:hypothetical protein
MISPGVTFAQTTHLGYTLNFVDPQGTARALATIEVVWTESQGHRTLYGVEGGAVLRGSARRARWVAGSLGGLRGAAMDLRRRGWCWGARARLCLQEQNLTATHPPPASA